MRRLRGPDGLGTINTLASDNGSPGRMPELTNDGELPPGVHIADWQEFNSRFGRSSPRRLWLSCRLQAILELAATGRQLRRAFVWGSFVTAKPAPRDLDILLIMSEDFEVDRMSARGASRFRFHAG